jgi:hypothetical protein
VRAARRLAVAAAFAFAVSGCAVGNFLAGAPSSKAIATNDALLLRRCTGCHEVPDPAAMTSASWLASLERMQRRMVLPASEWDSLAAMAEH